MNTPHEILNPDSLAPPSGFSHAVAAAAGRTVYLGGQAGHGPGGELVSDDLVAQFDRAAENVVVALKAAGGVPEHLVQLHIFVTEADEYRARLRELGDAYARSFGRHYPAIAFFEVEGLFDPRAAVEITAIAVIPEA